MTRRMTKYKATINVDRELWNRFRYRCDEKETTATAVISAHIYGLLIQEGYELEGIEQPNSKQELLIISEEKLKELIEAQVQEEIGLRFAKIEERLEQWESSQREESKATNTVTLMGNPKPSETRSTQTSLKLSKSSQQKEEKKKKSKMRKRTEQGATKTDTQTEKGRLKTSSRKHTRMSQAQEEEEKRRKKKLYSDTEVAKEEGVGRATITRYRTGKRKPTEDFRKKWVQSKSNSVRWERA